MSKERRALQEAVATVSRRLNTGWTDWLGRRLHQDRALLANLGKQLAKEKDATTRGEALMKQLVPAFVTWYQTEDSPQPPLQQHGPFLMPSFWAFASRSEIHSTLAAVDEAFGQIGWGITVATRARMDGSQAAACVRRWFGRTPGSEVAQRLKQLRDKMATENTPITYQGQGLADNLKEPKLKELVDIGNQEAAPRIGGEVGWGALARQRIGFTGEYFKFNTRQLQSLQNIDDLGLGVVTRGGAIVHEMTHVHLATKDTDVFASHGKAVVEQLLTRIPNRKFVVTEAPAAEGGFNSKVNGKEALGYGPRLCRFLAELSPEKALENADSYRLFCEEANFIRMS
jgi:hypothetical protein